MTHVLQCVWPVLDESMTLSQLIAEARGDLAAVAIRAHAAIAGPARWELLPAADVAGWHAHAPGSVLVAKVPAVKHPVKRETSHRLPILARDSTSAQEVPA